MELPFYILTGETDRAREGEEEKRGREMLLHILGSKEGLLC